jgi:ribosomal protein L7/L12
MKLGRLEIKVTYDSPRRNVRRWMMEELQELPHSCLSLDDPVRHKLHAIKEYRTRYGIGMKDSKEAVEKIIGW